MRPIIVVVALLSFIRSASASCGVAACPMHLGEIRQSSAGALELGYEFEYVPQDKPRIGDRPAYVGQVRGHHDEAYTVSRVHRLRGSAELSRRWGLDVTLPYISRSHGHVHHHRGAVIRDSWSIGGLGDVSLLGRYRFWLAERPALPTLSLLLGVKLPTGRENLVNAANEEADVPVQPGSGSWDYTLGVGSLQTLSAPSFDGRQDMPLFFSGTYRWNGKGKQDYRIGDVFQANAGLLYPVVRPLSAQLQLNLRVNRQDDKGLTREEVQKTGGTALFLSPGLELRPMEKLRLYALVQVPVYQWVQSIQLTSAYTIVSGAAWRFP